MSFAVCKALRSRAAAVCSPRCFSGVTSIAKLQRRWDRLEGLLQRVERPRLESIEFEGARYQLPVPAMPTPAERPSEAELAYWGGLFDGDGCVTMTRKTGRIRLTLGQSVRGVDLLMRLRLAFGGGVYRSMDGTGYQYPSVCWQICGTGMKQAAAWLATSSVMKRDQLHIASEGNVEQQQRQQVADLLSRMKQKDFVPQHVDMSWPYFAGFFDAEGCIQVPSSWVSVSLSIGQSNPHVLHSLKDFLLAQSMSKWHIHTSRGSSRLGCTDFKDSKLALEQLIANGLQRKLPQAQLALGLSPESHSAVRKELFQLTGQQSRYRRVGSEVADLAKQIHCLRNQLRRCTFDDKAEALMRELAGRTSERETRQLAYKCRMVSADLRRLLFEGARLRPL
ncbi:unnamed protein product [Effrenium voratum]|uniref:LAGLIDADG endonuclease n=1 Tax=Effrenium voratum TaxID=2562239 RepID=A0AA36JF05_9DINO|nr:unnamed protein product [Effrenium voratum]CAJ1419345.1 unnamed protein product [Effrenium voratum]